MVTESLSGFFLFFSSNIPFVPGYFPSTQTPSSIFFFIFSFSFLDTTFSVGILSYLSATFSGGADRYQAFTSGWS